MPSKNKPKRFDRNTNRRVARRKKKQRELLKGSGRNRKKRPKHKGENRDIELISRNEAITITKKVTKKIDKEE